DVSTNFCSAHAPGSARAIIANTPIVRIVRTTFSSSGDDYGCSFNDIAHEPTWIPIGRDGLNLTAGAGTSHHQHLRSSRRRGKTDLPLAEAVFALVLAQRRLLPSVATVAGETDAQVTCTTPEGN